MAALDDIRPIPGYEGLYSVTADGRVRSHGRIIHRNYPIDRPRTHPTDVMQLPERWLKPGRTMHGYLTVSLINTERVQRTHPIHQLVLLTWGPPKPSPFHEPNHKDSDRTNNSLENLEWVTRRENMFHAKAKGRTRLPPHEIGEKNGLAKLTEKIVLEIRYRYANGESQGVLAHEFKVTRTNIGYIIRRATWKHI